jgi:hypothetical protein
LLPNEAALALIVDLGRRGGMACVVTIRLPRTFQEFQHVIEDTCLALGTVVVEFPNPLGPSSTDVKMNICVS